jgi:hypothetical protein
MVLMDWNRISFPYADDDLDPLEILVSRARAKDVQTVIVDGRIVYQDGVYPGLDHEAIFTEIETRLRSPLPDSVRLRRQLYTELEPHLRRFYAGWELDTTPLYQLHSIT